VQLLPAATVARDAAAAGSVSHRAGAGAPTLSVRRGWFRDHEHIHLLFSEPQVKTPSTVMQALKISFARRVLAQAKRRRNPAQTSPFDHIPQHVWQKRFYDFNVWTARKRTEKLRYMHRNPVQRGLVGSPELWRWSSYRAYAFGESGPVKVNDWTVLKMKVRPPAV
jgi:putative transposase